MRKRKKRAEEIKTERPEAESGAGELAFSSEEVVNRDADYENVETEREQQAVADPEGARLHGQTRAA